jgi:hypothetical protein
VIREIGHIIQCNNLSELETPDDGRVRPKDVVRRKGDNNKLHCRRKYIVWNKLYSYITAIGCLNTTLWEWTVLSARSVPRSCKEDNWGNGASSVRKSMKKRVSWKGAAVQRGLKRGSRRISTVRSRYQGTASENTSGWKRQRVLRWFVKCGDWRWRCNYL